MRSPRELLERADELLRTADNLPKEDQLERETAVTFATLAIAHARVAQVIEAATARGYVMRDPWSPS